MKRLVMLSAIGAALLAAGCAGTYKVGREEVFVDGVHAPRHRSGNELPTEHHVPGEMPYEREVPPVPRHCARA